MAIKKDFSKGAIRIPGYYGPTCHNCKAGLLGKDGSVPRRNFETLLCDDCLDEEEHEN